MSVTPVELVRRATEAFNRGGLGDVDEFLGFLDPDVEWVNQEGAVESDTYHGHEGVRRYFEVLSGGFQDFVAQPEEFVQSGNRVVVNVRLRAHGRDSGARSSSRQLTYGKSPPGRWSGSSGSSTAIRLGRPPA